jgi:glutathione S-transferase
VLNKFRAADNKALANFRKLTIRRTPMNTLHYFPGNASMAPHIVLQEIGAPFVLQWVDRTSGAHKSADYLKLNPNGLIPVLTDGDLVLFEAAAICLHLVDSHPQAHLAPALGTPARAQFYKWLVWLTNTLQSHLIVYFYPERWVNAGETAAVAQVKAHAQEKVAGCLQQLDAQLAHQTNDHGGPWLLPSGYSAVDAYAFMLCRWTRGFADKPARAYTHIGPYLQRVLARPAVQRVISSEQLGAPLV